MIMANASRKHMGPGAQGKGAGVGAMTDENSVKDQVGENDVLSNRDKSRHSDERGLDAKSVQTEQLQDHSANPLDDAERP
jgi:hypothetical protein